MASKNSFPSVFRNFIILDGIPLETISRRFTKHKYHTYGLTFLIMHAFCNIFVFKKIALLSGSQKNLTICTWNLPSHDAFHNKFNLFTLKNFWEDLRLQQLFFNLLEASKSFQVMQAVEYTLLDQEGFAIYLSMHELVKVRCLPS